MTCARCEELEERVAWLESELRWTVTADARVRLAKTLGITPGAALMLQRLHAAKGRFVSTLQLHDATSPAGHDDDRDPKHVSVRICLIRRAIGKDAIETVYSQGYRLTPAGIARVDAILAPEALAA